MQLTSTTDYSIRLVCFLAYKEEPCSTATIAASANIPNNYIPKIIKKLKIANIVGSVEGVQGGYFLLKKPETITLWDILDTMESTMKINKCLEEKQEGECCVPNYCHNRETCRVRAVFEQFQMDLERKLEEVTIAELIGKAAKHPFGNTYVTLEIDAETGKYKRVYAYDAFVRDYIPKEGDFREFIKKYIEEYVQEDDKERITELTDIGRIEEDLINGYWEKQTRFRQRVRDTEKDYVWMELHQYFNIDDNVAIFVLQNSILAARHMSSVEEELESKSKSIEENYWFAIELLSRILNERNLEYSNSRLEIIHYTEKIYQKLAELYPELEITEVEIKNVAHLAPIHNVGKIRLPKEMFLRLDELTEEEEKLLKTHPELGAEIVARFPKDKKLEHIQQYSHDICLYHHERYDGSGYPYGLKGEEIPLCAQVVGLVDVYEELINSKNMHVSVGKEKAIQMILSGKCGSFSETLLHSFLAAAMQSDWEPDEVD